MRLSDADREQLLEQLKRHAAAGRIGIEELERRVAVIVGAQTREQATEVLADLPPLGALDSVLGAQSRKPRWGRGHAESDAPGT